ncbi:unannotated protein [freshwater metagenome]|uniref:Unannotated protein n=1 Tax=freshwater metagenome TaxID=449393 RepID=A0A6J6G487_9ZZZZ
MTATLILIQHIHLTLKVGVRSNRTRLTQNLTTLNIFLLRSTKKSTNIVASLTLVKKLAEHFHTSAHRFLRITQTNDLYFITSMNTTLLNLASHNSSTTSNREHIFNRHQERLIQFTHRLRNRRITRSHQLHNLFLPSSITLKSLQRRHPNNRSVITRELILVQQLTNLKLHQL